MNIESHAVQGVIAGRRSSTRLKPETRQGYVLLCAALWSAIAFLFMHRFVVTAVVVDGQSMSPTMAPGDYCFVNRWLPLFREFKRGDLVVVRDHQRGDFMVKRIVGLPNERIQLRGGRVFINSQLLKEHYLAAGIYTYSRQIRNREITIAENSFFVLGDNRLYSEDSRAYGDVDRADIVGLISRQ
jgi:signal peptidase I